MQQENMKLKVPDANSWLLLSMSTMTGIGGSPPHACPKHIRHYYKISKNVMIIKFQKLNNSVLVTIQFSQNQLLMF